MTRELWGHCLGSTPLVENEVFKKWQQATTTKGNLKMATYASIKQLSELEPVFTEASLRHYIFHADKNGLTKAGAISRLGKKVVIHVEKFMAWIESGAAA